jgi:hypothetical protein
MRAARGRAIGVINPDVIVAHRANHAIHRVAKLRVPGFRSVLRAGLFAADGHQFLLKLLYKNVFTVHASRGRSSPLRRSTGTRKWRECKRNRLRLRRNSTRFRSCCARQMWKIEARNAGSSTSDRQFLRSSKAPGARTAPGNLHKYIRKWAWLGHSSRLYSIVLTPRPSNARPKRGGQS